MSNRRKNKEQRAMQSLRNSRPNSRSFTRAQETLEEIEGRESAAVALQRVEDRLTKMEDHTHGA